MNLLLWIWSFWKKYSLIISCRLKCHTTAIDCCVFTTLWACSTLTFLFFRVLLWGRFIISQMKNWGMGWASRLRPVPGKLRKSWNSNPVCGTPTPELLTSQLGAQNILLTQEVIMSTYHLSGGKKQTVNHSETELCNVSLLAPSSPWPPLIIIRGINEVNGPTGYFGHGQGHQHRVPAVCLWEICSE